MKGPYKGWRARIGWRLRCWADRIDPKHGPRMVGWSFTFELGEGIRFRDDRRGCPLAYLGEDDYQRAHDEADKKSFDWSEQIAKWVDTYPRNDTSPTGRLLFETTPPIHSPGRVSKEIRTLFEQGVLHHSPTPPYLEFAENPDDLHNPAYWWIHNKSPCFYKPETWVDGGTKVLICRIHKTGSRHDVTEGFDKPCLTLDPLPKENDDQDPSTSADRPDGPAVV
jgi:hypothetical protein